MPVLCCYEIIDKFGERYSGCKMIHVATPRDIDQAFGRAITTAHLKGEFWPRTMRDYRLVWYLPKSLTASF